jgi:hypothetical protein
MAAFNGVNYARTIALPVVKIPPGEIKGQVLFAYDEYTSLANLGAADTINLGIKIPAGARVIAVTVKSPTNGGTMSVGIAGTATKYVNAATAATTTTIYPFAAVNTVDEDLIVTMGAATATGVYNVCVQFVKV